MSMGGPKTTTTYNQQQNQQQQQQQQQSSANIGQSSITPNLPAWLSNYYQGFPSQQGQLLAQTGALAQRPLYGQQQQANYQQQLGQQLAQANQNLQSSLARSGALNSNRAAEAQTNLALGGAQQMGNYLAQTPLLNAQFQQSALGQLGNMLTNAMNWKPPVIGQTTDTSQLMNMLSNMTGSSQSDTSGTQTQQQSGGLLQSLLGGLLNAGMGIATGGLSNLAGGLFGGGGGGGPVSDTPAIQNIPSQFAQAGGFGSFPQGPIPSFAQTRTPGYFGEY